MANEFPQLQNDERVKQEIEKYKWIESEKAGYDIGHESAAESWFKLYGSEWVKFNNLPDSDSSSQPMVDKPMGTDKAVTKNKKLNKK